METKIITSDFLVKFSFIFQVDAMKTGLKDMKKAYKKIDINKIEVLRLCNYLKKTRQGNLMFSYIVSQAQKIILMCFSGHFVLHS